MLEKQLTQEREFTKEELEMQAKVKEFQKALAERDYVAVHRSLNETLQAIEPLNFWLPYKDLTKLLIKRCIPCELSSLSEKEIKYLVEISNMLGDKEAPLGLQTVKEVYTELEELKADRTSGIAEGLRAKPLDAESLREILMPADIEKRIAEFRTRQYDYKAEGKGFWTSWETISDISASGLENIVASGVNSELTSKYLETFMGENLYTNVFQCGDPKLLAHLTKVFELYFRLKQHEGMPVEDMPGFVERRMYEYIEKKGDVRAWRGVKEFTMMHISNEFKKSKFLGANWREYDTNQRCLDWIFEFADKGNLEKMAYINDVAGMCCRGFGELTSRIFEDSVLDFTRKYVREGKIDEELGRKIFLIASSVKTNSDVRTQLSQPFTHKAIMDATEKHIPFAVGLHLFLYKPERDVNDPMISLIMSITEEKNKTPYLDHEANESREHAEARLEKNGCFEGFEFMKDAEEAYSRAVRNGRYISPVNECNTSLENIAKLEEEARTKINELKQKRKATDYIFVRKNRFFMADDKKQAVAYVGNPRGFEAFGSLLGYWTSCRGHYNPEKDQPERHVVIEFEDKKRKKETNEKILADLFIYSGKGYKFPLRLTKADTQKEERILLELV